MAQVVLYNGHCPIGSIFPRPLRLPDPYTKIPGAAPAQDEERDEPDDPRFTASLKRK